MQSLIGLEEYIVTDNTPQMTQKAFKIFVGPKKATEKKTLEEWKALYSLMLGTKTNIK